MSETTTPTAAPTPAAPQSVRAYRHNAGNTLTRARRLLPAGTGNASIDAARKALNGAISSVLRGKAGLSQAQQVQSLQTALDRVTENLATLPEHLAGEGAEDILATAGNKAKAAAEAEVASLTSQIAHLNARLEAAQAKADSSEPVDVADSIMGAAGTAQAILAEAVQYAAERDFETYKQNRQGVPPAEDWLSDVADGDESYEQSASEYDDDED